MCRFSIRSGRTGFLLVLSLWFLLWVLSPSALGAGERTHVVKRGESLWSVAHHYGVSVSELSARNGLKSTSWLMTGQVLKIPPAKDSARSAATKALPRAIQKAIDRAKVKRGRWKYIIIHHSGTEQGSAKGMNEYHLRVRHMEHGLAYHFVIGNGHGMPDGKIYVGNRWKQQFNGGHLASEKQNTYCLGICLVGNFDKQRPTSRQIKSLEALIEALEKRCRLTPDAVKTHQQINVVYTRCPGKNFPYHSIMRDLRAAAGK